MFSNPAWPALEWEPRPPSGSMLLGQVRPLSSPHSLSPLCRRVHLRGRLHRHHPDLPRLPRLPGRQPGALHCWPEPQCLHETEILRWCLGTLAVLHWDSREVLQTQQHLHLPRGGRQHDNSLFLKDDLGETAASWDQTAAGRICGLNTFIDSNKLNRTNLIKSTELKLRASFPKSQ